MVISFARAAAPHNVKLINGESQAIWLLVNSGIRLICDIRAETYSATSVSTAFQRGLVTFKCWRTRQTGWFCADAASARWNQGAIGLLVPSVWCDRKSYNTTHRAVPSEVLAIFVSKQYIDGRILTVCSEHFAFTNILSFTGSTGQLGWETLRLFRLD